MAAITRIDVRIKTGDRSGAGTDADVFLAIAGREFGLDSRAVSVDDFERNSDQTYILGDLSNVAVPDGNDPRDPMPLDTADLDLFPVWIRCEAGDDLWNLEYVEVTVNPGPGQIQYKGLEGRSNLWMGNPIGKFLFLKKVASQRPE